MYKSMQRLILHLLAAAAAAQDPAQLLDSGLVRPAAPAPAATAVDPLARIQPQPAPEPPERPGAWLRQDRTDEEIRRLKDLESGPRRFGADLFDGRQPEASPTLGGISDDYLLGPGDRLQLSVFGSATFELPVLVDGRGALVVPRVGTVSVAGLTLGRARAAVEAKVRQVFSRSVVDLAVTRLREVRVFVMGEVYRPGGFLVPSLSSVVNVLALAGGPTGIGSFRRIRVLRGGRAVHTVDLYPLRSEGVGDFNLGFMNGDTVFVPLAQNEVRLEGAFTRVVAQVREEAGPRRPPETVEQRLLRNRIRDLEERLGLPPSERSPAMAGPRALPGTVQEAGTGLPPGVAQDPAGPIQDTQAAVAAQAMVPVPAAAGALAHLPLPKPRESQVFLPGERAELENSLEDLRDQLQKSKSKIRNDKRVEERVAGEDFPGQPAWLRQWLQEGRAPAMRFEMLPGETVRDALGFAGGFALKSFSGTISLGRIGPDGALTVLDVPAGDPMASTEVQRGDVLTALPLRDPSEKSVTVAGWARVQGTFAREEGMRVGALLKRYALVLPDTYLARGELVHLQADGTKRYAAFDLTRALAGDPGHDLRLEDHDEVDLYRVGDLRLPKYLKVVGPVARPGSYEFLEGMRASDLLFRAGVPQERANRFVAELAHAQDGSHEPVERLDLARLLSTEGGSPVDLKDDRVNPVLRPGDQISVYARPDYHRHRSIILSGQVVRPGIYELDTPDLTLRDLFARAGGLTAEAMPRAGIFLRTLGPVDPERRRMSILAGVEHSDPTSNGINEVLSRLNETKRMPLTGSLLTTPLLHGLQSGNLNRLVVDIPGILAGRPGAEVELLDGDEVIIPRRTDVAYVVGETSSPFAAFKVAPGARVGDLVALAGGYTRNADSWHVCLLKADGRVVDRRISHAEVEPGDAVLVPQRVRRDVTWQENLAALTPLAILINTFKN